MNNTTRKVLLGVLIVPVLSTLGFAGYQIYLAPPPEVPQPEVAVDEPATEVQMISAEGKLVPHEFAHLGFNIPGQVEALSVREGQDVLAGEVLASLKGQEQLEATISAAQLDLISAQQDLDELYDLAPLMTAEAQAELANARDALDEAEYRWRVNQEGSRATGETISTAEANLAMADEAVARAQKRYNRHSGKPVDNPARALAYTLLIAAKQSRERLLQQLNWYKGKPSDIDLAMLDAGVAMAEARLAEAERMWAILKDGPDPDQVALAQARLESAQTRLLAAQANLDDLELRAPINGRVITLDLKTGESVSPGIPVVVLADTSQWQIETTDLTENDFAMISPGMQADINLNAYPDREFRGVVCEIGLLGEERRGAVTYTIKLDFEPEDSNVQWGMTAFVDLVVP